VCSGFREPDVLLELSRMNFAHPRGDRNPEDVPWPGSFFFEKL
jgi:hypothetical protein